MKLCLTALDAELVRKHHARAASKSGAAAAAAASAVAAADEAAAAEGGGSAPIGDGQKVLVLTVVSAAHIDAGPNGLPSPYAVLSVDTAAATPTIANSCTPDWISNGGGSSFVFALPAFHPPAPAPTVSLTLATDGAGASLTLRSLPWRRPRDRFSAVRWRVTALGRGGAPTSPLPAGRPARRNPPRRENLLF